MEKEIKVLLIDDEADFTVPMAFWLKSKGYAVDVASNGEKGVQSIKENPPDIVFLDLNMPVLDGVGALKKIRELDKEIPVIMISSYVDDLRIRETFNYDVSGVFYKGKEFTELTSLLEIALRRHKKL